MKVTFKYSIPKNRYKKEEEIIEDIMWHNTKIYNMLLYEIRENSTKLCPNT